MWLQRTQRGYLAASKTASATAAEGWEPTTLARYFDNRVSGGDNKPLGDIVDPVNHQIFLAGLKSPRGPFTPKAIEHVEGGEGRYLLIYYNNHGAARNPYWLSAGLEVAGEILWSQPELVIYDRDTHAGTSAVSSVVFTDRFSDRFSDRF